MTAKEAKIGMRVRVSENKPDGSPHPHAGKTGRIEHIHYLVGPQPTAHVLIDKGFSEAGRIAVVSPASLTKEG